YTMSVDVLKQNIYSLLSHKVNVVAFLHNWWEQKQAGELDGSSGTSHGSTCGRRPLLYESSPSPGPPYVCYVTLPGGSCFGNYKVCESQAEAQRDAARVALMNTMVNELPCRLINSQFITQTLQQAVSTEDADDPSTSIGSYNLLLQSYVGRTMLEFQEMMTVFQLLHWNGTLKALRERRCSRQSVISYYSQRGLDECMRSSMALDWLGREQRSPGILGMELQAARRELLLARRRGVELRFHKEKTEILSLAMSQAYVYHTAEVFDDPPPSTSKEDHLPLNTLYSQHTDEQMVSSPSATQQNHCHTSGKHWPSSSL
uniref:Protein limb expression 1 homolog n=1 Tax=Gouania willdenowi TaxID=441366 RepID=A0A8C5DBF4_GOUWI